MPCYIFYKPELTRELTINAAGLNPGNMGTLCEEGGGEQTTFDLGSSSESDSLRFTGVSVPPKNENNQHGGKSRFQSFM